MEHHHEARRTAGANRDGDGKRREEAEREQHPSLQAIAGLQKEIERHETQKTDLLDIYLNRSKVGKLIMRKDYEAKAAQMADEIERLKAQLVGMQQRNGPDVPNKEQADEPIRLPKAVRVAAEKATFAEKRTILRLLDVHVLYNREMLELSGGVPAQAVDLEKLLKGDPTGGNSLPRLNPHLQPILRRRSRIPRSLREKGHDYWSLYAQ